MRASLTYKVFGVWKENVPPNSNHIDVHHSIHGRNEIEIDELRRGPYWTVGLNLNSQFI